MLSLFFFFLVMSVIKLLLNREHFITSLLCLEMFSMLFYFYLILWMTMKSVTMFYSLYFISAIVCESCLGLSLLVLVSYFYGSEHLSSITFLLC